MCTKENTNVRLYSLKKLYEMRKNGAIGIPAVQRGLVWEPSKIVNLWDSLVKGYPIGIFQCYNDSNGAKALIDGQQRLNAICLGFENSEQATMWVAEKEDGEPVFMVCTIRHPWGYQRNEVSAGAKLTAFSAAKRDKQNQELKNDDDKRDVFKIADLKEGMPMEQYHKHKYCPLPSILNSDTPPAGFESLWNSDWAKRLRDIGNEIVPLVTIPDFKPEPARLRELFARINRGGSPLSPRDELYSAICVYGESKDLSIKKENNALRENFLPEERITRLAARMAKSAVAAQNGKWDYTAAVSTETICDWFKNNEPGSGELIRLYGKDGPLQHAKETFMACIGKIDDLNRVPSYIYLSAGEDNWLYVIFSLIEHYPKLFNENTDMVKKFFPLLCLLPYVMCGTAAPQGLKNFCRGFYNAAMNTDSVYDILELMAIGMVGASFEHTFTWPYPRELNNLDGSMDISQYSSYWLNIYRSIYGCVDNNILYYYQREYVNKMLKSGFDPAEPSTWEGSENKPWDMDHVIPKKWWGEDPDNIRNEIGNMQIMYFRHNRMKNDSYAGAYEDAHTQKCEENEVGSDETHLLGHDERAQKCEDEGAIVSSYFLYSPNEYKSIVRTSDFADKRNKVRNRQKNIIKKLYDALNICDLIERIGSCDYIAQSELAKTAKMRLDKLQILSAKYGLGEWGICTYEWKQQCKSTRYVTWLPVKQIDFYRSLVHWIIVGKEVTVKVNDETSVSALLSVQANVEPRTGKLSYIVGMSRPIGVSRTEWDTVCATCRDKFPDADEWFLEKPTEISSYDAVYKALGKLQDKYLPNISQNKEASAERGEVSGAVGPAQERNV